MTPTTSQIGLSLREARIRARLTQKDAARLLRVDKQTISRWERAERSIKADDYERAMARYAEVSTGPSSGVGKAVPRGTLGLPPRLAPLVDRFEREIIRMGASDFEIDHIRAVLRAPEMAKLFHMGDTGSPLTPEQQDAELGIQLEALRLWVTLHMRRRTQAASPSSTPSRKRGA